MDNNFKGTEYLVIGGGLMGCSIAYFLSLGGAKVALFESRNIASGASGRNGGQVVQLEGRDSNPDTIRKRLSITQRGCKILGELEKEWGSTLEFRQIGSLDLALNEEEAEQLKEVVKIQNDCGDTDIVWIEGKEVRKLSPSLKIDLLGARFRPSDGVINPFKLTHGFAQAARKNGAKIFTHQPVKEIVIQKGKAEGVLTNGRFIKAERAVINVTNAWSPFLTPEIDILPLRQVAVVTERVPELKVFPTEAIMYDQAIFTTTQTASGNFVVGGLGTLARKRQDHYDETVYPVEFRGSTTIIQLLFKDLENINVIRSWAGPMAITADGLPCIGYVPETEKLFIASGFSNGMVYAPMVGKLSSEIILQGKASLPVDILDPARYFKTNIKWPEAYNYTVLAEFLSRI